MTSHLLEPKQIKAPSWMNASQRADFRRLIRGELVGNHGVSQRKVDEITDYIDVSARLDAMRAKLASEVGTNSPRDVDRARILTINGQINSLVALRQKLGAKL